jgi:pseudaminic acid cytidylyltransferase
MESSPLPAFAMSVDEQGHDAGCFYWGWASAFITREPLDGSHTEPVVLPPERVCDINTLEDWACAESMYEALRRAS